MKQMAGLPTMPDQTTEALVIFPKAAFQPRPEQVLKNSGERLYEALFNGEVRSALDQTTSAAYAQNIGTRIRLIMDLKHTGMGELASLPWELMRPKDEDPLVISIKTTLVRSLDVAKPSEPRPFIPPLRILVIMSNPKGTLDLNLEEERSRIKSEWNLLPGVKVDFVSAVVDDLLKQLAAEEYHVVHYMGHGDFDADSGGMLLLERKDGSPHPVSGEKFAIMLSDEPLRLVFLNACNTGTTVTQSGPHPFAGVAAALIRKGVPAVLAMQFPISDNAAIDFSRTFYERIVQKMPVDAAVAEARKALLCDQAESASGAPEEPEEWATPVLYMRARDGMLFDLPQDDEPVHSDTPVTQVENPEVPDAPTIDDPWGDGDGDRVFLAATNENLNPLRRSLHKELLAQGFRVIGLNEVPPPPHDPEEHQAAVEAVVRAADLCVYLMGDQPGEAIGDEATGDTDTAPTDTAPTYPWEQCRIGLLAANSQLILFPDINIDSIDDPDYKSYVKSLITRPRSAERFELVRTGKQQMAGEIIAKLKALKEIRAAQSAPNSPGNSVETAFVDAHRSDLQSAIEVEGLLTKHKINVVMQAANTSPSEALAEFDVNLSKYPLYVLVAGNADEEWVENRETAAMKSASRTRAQVLIGRYQISTVNDSDDAQAESPHFELIAAMNECDDGPIKILIKESGASKE